MQAFENQVVSREQCPVLRGPKEWENSLRYTQNVTLHDLEFVNCEFIGEGLATYGAPINRSTARNVRLKTCCVNSFFGSGAIFDEVVVDGLRTRRAPVILSGCACRHVVLAGQCGRFLFNRRVCHDNDLRNANFISANATFYASVDWALDISNVKLSGLEIRGTIPTRLIRRNPDEHFIMTRSIALAGEWRNYEPFGSFQIGVSMFLESDAEDDLFVAARGSKYFKQEVEYFHRLKSNGLMT